jgi:hypothetical protein
MPSMPHLEPTRRAMLARSAGIAAAAAAAGGAAGLTLGSGTPAVAAATTAGALTYLTPTKDTTGNQDYAAISAALQGGTAVMLLPGTFYINQTITVPGDATLMGCGPASGLVAVAQDTASNTFGGTAMIEFAAGAYNFMVKDMAVGGASNTTSSNPAADVFSPGAGANRWWIENIDVNYCNGWVLNPDFTGPMAGIVHGVQGTNNTGGIRIVGTDTSGSSGQVAISDVNLQFCTNAVLVLQDVDDIAVSNLNAAGGQAQAVVQVLGGCQDISLSGLDVGMTSRPSGGSVPVLEIASVSGGGSPTEVSVVGSSFIDGGIGVLVSGTASRIRFHNCTAMYNAADGWQFNGTGTAILVDGCSGCSNNESGGTNFDVRITGSPVATAHVGIFQFAYCSTGVTNALNIGTTSNHVSNVNPTYPGGMTTQGDAANGW